MLLALALNRESCVEWLLRDMERVNTGDNTES